MLAYVVGVWAYGGALQKKVFACHRGGRMHSPRRVSHASSTQLLLILKVFVQYTKSSLHQGIPLYGGGKGGDGCIDMRLHHCFGSAVRRVVCKDLQ